VISKGSLVLNYTTQKIVIIPIPVKTIQPTLTTDKVNKMGIKELIGTGTSLFQHSIESRIYNVNLAASRVNGVLVKPGDTFSFDQAVGDVSSLTGYKQAYVIENGKTVLGDGGGVCQVSTTLFRAALNAGLPIVERHAHAYRVGYYEEDSPPGIDATVYVPTVDLKFRNDTGHYILIQSIVDLNTLRLTFMIYGTSDGRISNVSTPVVTNIRPAPPDKYEDDPTLPAGTIKQVDFAASGADATFTRTVTKDGKVLYNDVFTSHYQPWQAVYLRGTKT
jgi:vancomycin resistance protein YoaR